MQISKGVRWLAKGSMMVLAIWWGSSYLINRGLHLPARPPEASKPQEGEEHPANEAKFRALVDSGNQAYRNGQYSDALDYFHQAEQSGVSVVISHDGEQLESLARQGVLSEGLTTK